MQRTDRYLDPSRVAGADPEAGLTWLRRRDRWDRRLRALEATRDDGELHPGPSPAPVAASSSTDRALAR